MKNICRILFFLFFNLSVFQFYAQPSIAYQGGPGNGYSSDDVITNTLAFYKGGGEEGAYSAISYFNNLYLYKGGGEIGTYFGINVVNNIALYKGGFDDGYTSFYNKKDFIWTGAIGQGWTVSGNWNYNVVPDINRRTIIPSGVPHYPHINAGLFAIGSNPNNGFYKSGELIILPGALLVTRVNCKVENYGLIQIEGHLNVKKQSSDAFKNETGSQVIVLSGGLFSFQ